MTFKLVSCKGPEGLPLLEIRPGPYVMERLSPGTVREADIWENFRWGRGGNMLFACPRGKTNSKGVCTAGQRLLRIRHKKSGLKKLLDECKNGKLSSRRKRELEKILKDVKERAPGVGGLNRAVPPMGPHFLIAPEQVAVTPMGRLAQFAVVSFATVVMFMIWVRLFWPDETVAAKGTK